MYVEVKVTDTGKGISESNQAAIFRRFYREEEVHEQQGAVSYTHLDVYKRQFPAEIAAAAEKYDPARITRYVIDIATAFHRFYNACRILEADPAVRLSLIHI